MRHPNVLFILADDLGWGDVGYHGSPIRTPNIDRLVRRGVELDRHYVCPVCTPSRVSLMTGRHPGRFGRHATVPSNDAVLPDNYYTLANLFRDAGYATGLFGKWHLGSDPRHGANYYGFDYAYGSFAGGVDPYSHLYKPGPFVRTWHRNGTPLEERGHATDLIADEATAWIERQAGPWFCYVPFTAVHTPIRPPEAWKDRYADGDYADDPEKDEAFKSYAAYTSHMDHAVGRLIETLKTTDQLGDTLIVFTSDNGAVTWEMPCDMAAYPGYRDDMHPVGSNGTLRGTKAQLYEGGIRTPAVLAWPGTIAPGRREAPMHMVDWMPTFARLLGQDVPGDPCWDGRDQWETLAEGAPAEAGRTFFWNLLHDRFAVQEDGWKLIRRRDGEEWREELFHLAEDPDEEHECAATHPDRVEHLRRRVEEQHALDDASRRADAPGDPAIKV